MKVIKQTDDEIRIRLDDGEEFVLMEKPHRKSSDLILRHENGRGGNLIVQPVSSGQLNIYTSWPGI